MVIGKIRPYGKVVFIVDIFADANAHSITGSCIGIFIIVYKINVLAIVDIWTKA